MEQIQDSQAIQDRPEIVEDCWFFLASKDSHAPVLTSPRFLEMSRLTTSLLT